MHYVDPVTTVRAQLEQRAGLHADKAVLRFEGRELSYSGLDAAVNRLANGLHASGIGKGDRVAVMLGHHPDHIITFFALAKLGAVLVPVNVNLDGAPLEYLLKHSRPVAVLAESEFAPRIAKAVGATPPSRAAEDDPAPAGTALRMAVWRAGAGLALPGSDCLEFEAIASAPNAEPPPTVVEADDVLAICYTSGTTGAPKGALITDRMYRASAVGSLMLSGIEPHDVLLFWEPIYHLFGMEVLVLAAMTPVTLGMVDRFSASRFWDQVRSHGATHIHYVGGVPQLLMKQPPRDDDRDHRVRIAWGGGCPIGIWRAFEQRFGLQMRDSFGMTETASLNIINVEGEPGALGRPLPYFDVKIVDESGRDVARGETGELLVRGREPGLITPGYFENPEATAAAIRDGWLHTGDLVRQDERGIYFFVGRKKDSIRRRGENISAWEVERVLNAHPDVEESALVAVANEFGDEEIKAFIKPRAAGFDPAALIRWCEGKMARYQIPRFVAIVDAFPKTPTQRIMKHQLPRSIDDCWDRGDGH